MELIELKVARIKAGLRQIDLAQKVDVSPSLISLYEDGTKYPSPELARKLNKVIGKQVYLEAN